MTTHSTDVFARLLAAENLVVVHDASAETAPFDRDWETIKGKVKKNVNICQIRGYEPLSRTLVSPCQGGIYVNSEKNPISES